MRQSAPARTAPVRVVDMGRVQRVQPTVGAAPQGASQATPAAVTSQPIPQPPAAQQRPSASPPPAANIRPDASPANPLGRQNGRWATPVARPDAPAPNVNRRQQNAPPAEAVQQPSAAPPPAANIRPNTPPAEAVQRPSASPPPAANIRPERSPAKPAGRQNGRWATPVARPDAPAPNVNRRQQNAPPAEVTLRRTRQRPTSIGGSRMRLRPKCRRHLRLRPLQPIGRLNLRPASGHRRGMIGPLHRHSRTGRKCRIGSRPRLNKCSRRRQRSRHSRHPAPRRLRARRIRTTKTSDRGFARAQSA